MQIPVCVRVLIFVRMRPDGSCTKMSALNLDKCTYTCARALAHPFSSLVSHKGGRLEGEVECDFAVIEGILHASLLSREVATVGPSARVSGDVIYNVLELDRVSGSWTVIHGDYVTARVP